MIVRPGKSSGVGLAVTLAASLALVGALAAFGGPAFASTSRTASQVAVAGHVMAPNNPAEPAAQIYPGNCRTGAYGKMLYPTNSSHTASDWTDNCWVGYNNYNVQFLMSANYVTAVQRLVQTNGYGCAAGGHDGQEGANTHFATECYEQATGQTQDGVIGSNMWKILGIHTLYLMDSGYGRDFYEIFDGANTVEFERIDTCNDAIDCGYFVLGTSNASFPLMNIASPKS